MSRRKNGTIRAGSMSGYSVFRGIKFKKASKRNEEFVYKGRYSERGNYEKQS